MKHQKPSNPPLAGKTTLALLHNRFAKERIVRLKFNVQAVKP